MKGLFMSELLRLDKLDIGYDNKLVNNTCDIRFILLSLYMV